MATKLLVRVQVDRLPSFIDAGKNIVSQFGLRIAALVDLEPEDILPTDKLQEIAGELCPWKWVWPDIAKGIHDTDAWKLFALRKDNGWIPVEITSGDFLGPPSAPWRDFIGPLNEKIERIVDARGEAALATREAPIEGATVFGMVESAGDLPHPLPSGLNVFAVYQTTEDLSNARVIALPNFGLPSDDFDIANAVIVVTNPDDTTTSTPTATATAPSVNGTSWATQANFELHGSLLEPVMTRLANSPRLLDLSTLSVAYNVTDTPIGDEDYGPELPRRLAEAIDPAARIVAAFEGAVKQTDDKTLSMIQSDLGNPQTSWLVPTIDRVSSAVFLPTANGSNSVPSIAVILLDELARRHDPQLSSRDGDTVAASQALLRMLDESERKGTAMPDRRTYALMSWGRFRAAADLPVEPPPAEARSLEFEDGFRRFVREWWFGSSEEHPLEVNAPRRLAQRNMPDTIPVDIRRSLLPEYEAILAPEILLAPGVSFILRLDSLSARMRLQVGRHTLNLERATSASTINAELGGKTVTIPLEQENHLLITFQLSADRSTLFAIFNDAAKTQIDTPSLDLSRGRFEIAFSAEVDTVDDIRPAPPEALASERLAGRVSALGTRTNLALAYVGPYISGVLAGRQDWSTQRNPSVSQDFKQGIIAGVTTLSRAILKRLYAEAIAAIGAARHEQPPAWLSTFADLLIQVATNDASKLASAAIPEGILDRLTPGMSPPLVVRIDQFQNFSADAWARLAGYGVLISREKPGDNPSKWWTLNAADVYAMPPDADWKQDSGMELGLADPIAIPMGQGDGVRLSLVTYNDRWLAAGLASDTTLDSSQQGARQARRPERYQAPNKTEYPLPATSFGYEFGILPFLIGHGSVIPVWLRASPSDPFTRKGVLGKPLQEPLSDAASYVRKKCYLRPRSVGGPRFLEISGTSALPGVPDGILPLAGELPIRPTPVTVDAGKGATFFRDSSGDRGTLFWRLPSSEEQSGIRLLVGNIRRFGGNAKQAVPKLGVGLWATSENSPYPTEVWSKELHDVVDDLRISFVVSGARDDLMVLVERQTALAKFAEDEGSFDKIASSYAVNAKAWRDMFVEIAVPKASDSAQFEPPRADDVRYSVREAVDVDPPTVVTRNLIAPEAGHLSREIHVLDGNENSPEKKIVLRRPSVEFETYKRWINPPLIEVAGGPEQHKDAIKKAINDAYAISKRELKPGEKREDIGFEDPVVISFAVELVEVFPHYMTLGTQVTALITGADVFDPSEGKIAEERPRRPIILIQCGDQHGLSRMTTTKLKAVLLAGHVYELRTYPVVSNDKQEFSPFLTEDRLSPALKATLRRIEIGGRQYLLGSPTVATVEVATKDMPDLYADAGWDVDEDFVSVTRPPFNRDDVANIFLPTALVSEPLYPKIRYTGSARLYSQRWDWRGRPQSELDQHTNGVLSQNLNDDGIKRYAAMAFLDRRDDDIGRPLVTQLRKNHIYGSEPNLGAPARSRTALFTKNLDWKAGANLWRFGLGLTSRYAPMFPAMEEELAHLPIGVSGGSKWASYWLPDRSSGRAISRPGLALVLPLTEPLMATGATPPLLALFNERLYANSNIGDGIDAAIEVARHPYTDSEQLEDLRRLRANPRGHEEELAELERMLANHTPSPSDSLKYWQEHGPDSIRTSTSHDGNPIALRIDGPIGYTFDSQTEAGRFDHAGILISPVAQEIGPWSLVKLRFRRQEAPEALGIKPVPIRPRVPHVFQLSGNEFGEERIQYEGLVVEVRDILPGQTSEINLLLHTDTPSTDPVAGSVRIRFDRRAGGLTLNTFTPLGPAGSITLSAKDYENVTGRVVLSARERPEGAEQWTPLGDALIKVRISGSTAGVDVLERLDRDRWLNLNCVPLSGASAVPAAEPLLLKITETLHSGARVMPTRLSTFTPSLWCQFAESMSVLNVRTASSKGEKVTRVPVEDLTVIMNTTRNQESLKSMSFLLRGSAGLAPPAIISIFPTSLSDRDAQVEEILIAVLTRYVSDAFDRLRESPIGLVHLTDNENQPIEGNGQEIRIDLNAGGFESAWWASGETTPPLTGKGAGRVRFLRMLVPRPDAKGGFAPAATRQLSELFSNGMLDVEDLNPTDAMGMIIGISRPIEWRVTLV